MSAQPSPLLVDIGNSRIKYAFADDLSNMQICHAVADLTPHLKKTSELWLSSVGQVSQVQQLQTLAELHNVYLHIVSTQHHACGLSFVYEDISTLGVDRWLAMIAARQESTKPVAVISLGTANTCDILVENQHQGGWITPGFSVMRESLLKHTAHVFADHKFPSSLSLGNKTQECVAMGCLASQQGFVLMANNYLKQHFADYDIYLTGGAKDLVTELNLSNIRFFDSLVLCGLDHLRKKGNVN